MCILATNLSLDVLMAEPLCGGDINLENQQTLQPMVDGLMGGVNSISNLCGGDTDAYTDLQDEKLCRGVTNKATSQCLFSDLCNVFIK